MTQCLFNPGKSGRRWQYSEENVITFELRSDIDNWDEERILQTVQNSDADKKIRLRIFLTSDLTPQRVMEALHTIRRIHTTTNTNANAAGSNNNNNNHEYNGRFLSLDLLECRFSDDDIFQEYLELTNDVRDGIFQELSIVQVGPVTFSIRETTTRALGGALNNTLRHLHISDVDMKADEPSQTIFFDGLRNSRTITDISFGCLGVDFDKFYHAVKGNSSLERISVHDQRFILGNLEQFQDLLHHGDLNACGQAFLTPNNNNNDDDDNSSGLVPLKLWPLIFARIAGRLNRHQVYSERVVPNVEVRQARVIYELLQTFLVPELILHIGSNNWNDDNDDEVGARATKRPRGHSEDE